MPTKKKRILMCNDAHFMYTGYGKYGCEVLKRLAKTGKYELAELACYGHINDERDMHLPWKYYANDILTNDDRYRLYKSHPQNEFGKWRFERTCLDFKPDIVWDIRDPWMMSFEYTSPLRPFFHLAIMPTVDSAPQKEDWMDIFIDADGVLNYTEFGHKTLNKEGKGHINLNGIASPGVNLELFSPINDKQKHRSDMGFFPNANIIGTIMRNQARKLYPDLFESFAKFIQKCYNENEKDLANNTFLYVHCSYPDMGWEIPQLLKEHGIGRKVIFTYICKNCKTPFCAFFRDARTVCPRCNYASAVLPNASIGLSPEQLAQVIKTFDLYIQYSICEGFGMPMVEAAACGVPIMATDYSAMEDVVRNTNGIPIKIERMFRDIGTNSYRALPDNNYCAEQIYKFLKKPQAIKNIMGMKARKATEKYYNWDNTAKQWENYFDSVELVGLQGKWMSPMRFYDDIPAFPDPSTMSHSEFVQWLIINVMQEPQKIHSRLSMKWLRQLNYGIERDGKNIKPFTREKLYDEIKGYVLSKKECEKARCGLIEMENMDFIEFAYQRDKYLL